MPWGIFILEDAIHIVPTNNEGLLDETHIFDELCMYEPKLEQKEGSKLLVIHNKEQ